MLCKRKSMHWLPKGFIFVSINYRLLPAAAPLQQADDVARALAFVQQQASGWGGDPRKIILIGHSAGAHLVSLLAAQPQRAYDLGAKAWLGSVALDSAAMDVEQIMQGTHARFYDQAFGASPAYWAATSPLRQLDKTATPLLAVCSSQRSDACPAAQKFAATAKRLGVNAQLLSQDRSHKAINQDLGADNVYTHEVEGFMATLDSEVARRLGVPLDGVSFPGHFLVRLPVDDGLLVMDPFNGGRPLGVDELRERAKPHLGGDIPDDAALLHILNPASHRAILVRTLRNLHGVYAEREEWDRAARSADRVLKLTPDQPDALRDRGLAYLKMDYRAGAQRDLARYLHLSPDAKDATELREQLIELNAARTSRMH